ncbi:arginine--tRNA ligase [Ureaplasma ceti]|uniref:Arginine--tRNA ligase n=1 Tax=Ureaplasma ceti TaxID=3119530 RepID=A0ABP9U8Y2_9BACT
MIIQKINKVIKQALLILSYPEVNFTVDKSKSVKFGDFNTNVAMLLTKTIVGKGKSPMDIAQEIYDNMDKRLFEKVEIVRPGFINFYVSPAVNEELFKQIEAEKDDFPVFEKRNERYNVEYVSANPTGYLHIGHARNAVFGDAIAALSRKVGIDVVTEYIVNDAGNQMNMLSSSVLVRYKELFGQDIALPDNSYHGEEIKLVAQDLKAEFGDKFVNTPINMETFVIEDQEANQEIRTFSRNYLLKQIQDDLAALGTHIEIYYSELEIHKNKLIPKTIEMLGDNVYEQDGATWLKTTKFGDDKDRVLIKSDGMPTYFMPDIAYHMIKLNREPKPTKLINIWGADHYSYITRMSIALRCLGYPEEALKVLCMQMVRLVKDGEEFKMSKRSGKSLTLWDLVDAVGKDAARWFLISVSSQTHIELDVDLATKKDNNNPIYYVEYAHARASSILEKGKEYFNSATDFKADLLTEEVEKDLLAQLNFYKSTLSNVANNFEPHKLANYIYNLAKTFHGYYGTTKLIDETNLALTTQRLTLVHAVKVVLHNALSILGIDAYTNM